MKYKAWYGTAATIIVIILLLFFFPKLIHMSGDFNPHTIVQTQSHFYANDFKFSAIENNFKFAHAIKDTNEKLNKINPNYS